MDALDILIACKAFEAGKSRLAAVLDSATREALCRELFERVLGAALTAARRAGPASRVAVISESATVRARAAAAGAIALEDPGGGLDAALVAGEGALGGSFPLLVLPADLPLVSAEVLTRLADAGASRADVTIVPDRHGTGTNALVLGARARGRFPFAFGPGSLERHRALAAARSLQPEVRVERDVALDLDEAADLAAWRSRDATAATFS